MKFSEVFTSRDSIQLDKKTLVILRWIAIIGQYISVGIVFFILNFDLPFFNCSAVIVLGILSNIFLQFVEKDNQLSNIKASLYLLYDLIQLSLLLFFTGGVTNPFVILLVIPAIVSSTFLSLRSTINLSAITIVILVIILFKMYLLE